MIERLRLVSVTMVISIFLAFMAQCALGMSKSSSLEADPISFPPSEFWLAILKADGLPQSRSIKLLSLYLGMATMARGLRLVCKWALQRKI